MKNLATVVVVLLLALLQSCAMTATELKTAHPSWTDEQIEIVTKNQVYVGMPEDQFRTSWGRPAHEHVTQSRFGTAKFLHYYRRLICIRNGVVESIHSR